MQVPPKTSAGQQVVNGVLHGPFFLETRKRVSTTGENPAREASRRGCAEYREAHQTLDGSRCFAEHPVERDKIILGYVQPVARKQLIIRPRAT